MIEKQPLIEQPDYPLPNARVVKSLEVNVGG